MTVSTQPLICGSVKATSESITELDQGTGILTVEKGKIEKITLSYGYASERRSLKIILSLLMIIGGSYIFYNFSLKALSEISYGNTLNVKGIAALASIFAWGIVGIIFLKEAFQKRYFLKIDTGGDTRHIIFEKNTTPTEVHMFIDDIGKVFGYPTASEVNLTT